MLHNDLHLKKKSKGTLSQESNYLSTIVSVWVNLSKASKSSLSKYKVRRAYLWRMVSLFQPKVYSSES